MGVGGGRRWLPPSLPSAERPRGRWGAPGPFPLRLHILPSGPGMSLVLQTSQGFLQSGVGGPWEVLYRPLIKTICVNATKALVTQFFGAGKGAGAPGERKHDDWLTAGQGRTPGLVAEQSWRKKRGLLFISRRGGRVWALRAEPRALVRLFRPLSHSSYGVWRSEVGGHTATSLDFGSFSLSQGRLRWAGLGEGDRPYMCVQNWKSRKKKATTRAPTRM